MSEKVMVVRAEPFAIYGICQNPPRWLGWESNAEPLLFSREDAEQFCAAYKVLGWNLEIVPEPSPWMKVTR